MERYEVIFTANVERELRHIPRTVLQRVLDRIGALAEDPRPHGVKKLRGQETYRVRQGDYRIIYTIEDHILVVTVVRIGHRSDVYRD